MSLYEVIEDLCKEQNISVSEMCRRAGVPRGSLGDLKSGKIKSLNVNNTRLVAELFNLSFEDLMNIEPSLNSYERAKAIQEIRDNKSEKEKALEELSQEQRGLLEVTDKMSADDIKLMIEFAKRLKNGH